MNPDGPCECDHSHSPSEAPDEPTLRPCNGGANDGVVSSASGVWLPVSVTRIPLPRESALPRPVVSSSLSSQRTSDDVFRPPRPRTDDRSGVTLPAPFRT